MTRSLAALSILAFSAIPALAHPGHVLDDRHGHVHWDEVAIFAAIAAVVIGWGAARLYRLAGKARPHG